jgi:hypothetical protein
VQPKESDRSQLANRVGEVQIKSHREGSVNKYFVFEDQYNNKPEKLFSTMLGQSDMSFHQV